MLYIFKCDPFLNVAYEGKSLSFCIKFIDSSVISRFEVQTDITWHTILMYHVRVVSI